MAIILNKPSTRTKVSFELAMYELGGHVINLNYKELKKQYKSIAQRRVKLGLVLAKIGENEKISVSDEDLHKSIEEEILRNPDEKDKVLDHYKNPQALAALKAPIFEEKVINHIISNMIKTVEKKVSKKELFKK